MTTDEVLKIVDQLSQHKPWVYIGGSEPFIRKDFLTIVEHIKSHNLAVSFTTNGTLLDSAKIKMIVALGVETVNFSIDGPEALHDRVRGKGVFKKVTSSVKELSTYKRRKEKIKPIININITISSNIIGYVWETIKTLMEATDDGADFYTLHHLWYVTPAELAAHQLVTKRTLDCNAEGAASHVIPNSELIDAIAIARELSSIKDRPKIKMYPNMQYIDIVEYYSHDPIDKKRRCVAPFFRALIKPNGEVRFCPDEWIDDYVLGNVRNDSFINIWNNEKARRFRAELWKRKCFPGCKRCNWMFSLP